ncbi:MAG: hypothetical protein ABIJ91_00420 [Candidatus Kuenenbacteria bacterium]
MTKLSQYDDINAVLKKAKKSLLLIEEKYKESLREQEIPTGLQVEIKDFLGNLRSSLDYLRSKISKYNFPICKTKKEFDNSTTDLSSPIKETVEKWQPYNNNDWISWLSLLNNKSKHVTLIPQKKTEIIQTRVSHPQGGSVSWSEGVTFGGGVSVMGVPIDPQTQLPVLNTVVKTERIKWVDFSFDNKNIKGLPSDVSVLPFLKQCFKNVMKMIAEIEPTIKNEKN